MSKEGCASLEYNNPIFFRLLLHIVFHALQERISNPPYSGRMQLGVGATLVPECGAQSQQTSMHVAKTYGDDRTKKDTSNFGVRKWTSIVEAVNIVGV